MQDSGRLEEKVGVIKSENLWGEVRRIYREKKDLYLCKNDHNHPSFVIYVETVNQIYSKYFCR